MNYGMYSQAGNEAISGLIAASKALGLDWNAVSFALQVLARKPEFAESTDTVVREAVYCAMGFDKE